MWMSYIRLQLNAAKTRVSVMMLVETETTTISLIALRVGNDYVTPSTSERDLGIYRLRRISD